MWFTENPWPPIGICAAVFAVFLIRWNLHRKQSDFYVMLACVAAALTIFVVERLVVTEREQVEQTLRDLVWTFENEANLYGPGTHLPKNVELKTLSFISSKAPQLQLLALKGLELVRVEGNIRVTDVHVEMKANNTRALVHFRANGTFVLPDGSRYYRPTRWLVTWQKEGGQWKIIHVTRLNVVTGKPLGSVFSGP